MGGGSCQEYPQLPLPVPVKYPKDCLIIKVIENRTGALLNYGANNMMTADVPKSCVIYKWNVLIYQRLVYATQYQVVP